MKKQFVSPIIEIKKLTTTNLLANSELQLSTDYDDTTDYMDQKNTYWDFD